MRVYQFRHLGAVASLATFSLSRCVSCSAAEERDYAYFLKCASHLAFLIISCRGPLRGRHAGMGMWYLGGRWAGPSAPRGHLAWFLASRRQFVELYINAMASSPARLLQQFIEDESSALGRERGAFYPDNHHLITPLIVRAPGSCPRKIGSSCISTCSGECVPSIKTEGEFELLRAAHARVLLLQSEGYPVCTLPRARGLFLLAWMIGARCRTNRRPRWRLYRTSGVLALCGLVLAHAGNAEETRKVRGACAGWGAACPRPESPARHAAARGPADGDVPVVLVIRFPGAAGRGGGAEVVDKILAEDVSVEDGELIRSCLLRYLAASERRAGGACRGASVTGGRLSGRLSI